MLTSLAQGLAPGFVVPVQRSITICAPFGPDDQALAALPGTHRYTTGTTPATVAQAQAQGLTTVESTGWQLTPHPHRVSLLWLHPPAESPDDSNEPPVLRALRQFTPWVHARGWLIAITPDPLWLPDSEAVAWVDRLWSVAAQWTWRDPQGLPRRVFVAQPRHPAAGPNAWPDGPAPDWPPASTLTSQWWLPPTTPWHSTSQAPAPTRIQAALQDPTLWQRLATETAPRPSLSTADPIDTPIPLHRGHLAMLLTAGRLTGSIGTGSARHLVKGRVIPHTEVVDDTPTHRISETRYRIELHTLHPDGTLQAWHTPHESPVMDPGDDGAEDASDA